MILFIICGDVCPTGVNEEFIKGNVKELFSVYYVFKKDLVHGTDVDTELLGKPAVGFLLFGKLKICTAWLQPV